MKTQKEINCLRATNNSPRETNPPIQVLKFRPT